jgi:hypothetical protein
MRVFRGLKPVSEVGELRRDRVVLTWSQSGDYDGLLFGLVVENGLLRVEPLVQVGFRKTSGSGYTYVSMHQLDSPHFEVPARTDPQAGTVTVAPDLETQNAVLARLKELGLPHKTTQSREWPLRAGLSVSVGIRSFVDPLVKRCIAKVAFNYAAHVLGSAEVLKAAYSPCREFVRYAKGNAGDFVILERQPVFFGETDQVKLTAGHVLTLEWIDFRHLTSIFSPFNMVKYRVFLVRDLRGLWRPALSGHVFDWKNHVVGRMTSAPRGLMPF